MIFQMTIPPEILTLKAEHFWDDPLVDQYLEATMSTVNFPKWLSDMHLTYHDLSYKGSDLDDVYNEDIKNIRWQMKEVWKKTVKLHQAKDYWINHAGNPKFEAWHDDTSTPEIRRRIVATTITFIELMRHWSRVVKHIIHLVDGRCLFCSSVHHSEDCELYKNGEERYLRLSSMGLCQRCLGPKHASRNCGSACSACGRKHQQILCDKYRAHQAQYGHVLFTRHLISELMRNANNLKELLDICWKDDDSLPFPIDNTQDPLMRIRYHLYRQLVAP